MGKFVVIKDLLNIRSKPAMGDEFFIGELLLGEIVDMIDEPVEGETPPGANDNRWLRDNLNRFVSRAGLAEIGTYPAKKAAFLADAFNRPFFDENDKENESKWKVSWGHVDLEIWKVWKQFGTRGKGVRVVVIDDGCWHTENCLSNRLSNLSKCITGNTLEDFTPAHGTHSAGLVGAAGDDVFGVAPDCELVVFKAGSDLAFDPFDIAKALKDARDLEPDIISLSLSAFDDPSVEKEIKSCLTKDGKPILILAAAGNRNSERRRYPASYDGVFSVAAYLINNLGNREIFRQKSNPQALIKFLAPGKDVLSAGRQKERSLYDDTSAATAFAAGIVALLVAICKNKKISPASLLGALATENCCKKIEPAIPNNPFEGFGVLSPLDLINHFLNNP